MEIEVESRITELDDLVWQLVSRLSEYTDYVISFWLHCYPSGDGKADPGR